MRRGYDLHCINPTTKYFFRVDFVRVYETHNPEGLHSAGMYG